MKLRLPHKFQAALMAALASVSITTLSTGTLTVATGAALLAGQQAQAAKVSTISADNAAGWIYHDSASSAWVYSDSYAGDSTAALTSAFGFNDANGNRISFTANNSSNSYGTFTFAVTLDLSKLTVTGDTILLKGGNLAGIGVEKSSGKLTETWQDNAKWQVQNYVLPTTGTITIVQTFGSGGGFVAVYNEDGTGNPLFSRNGSGSLRGSGDTMENFNISDSLKNAVVGIAVWETSGTITDETQMQNAAKALAEFPPPVVWAGTTDNYTWASTGVWANGATFANGGKTVFDGTAENKTVRVASSVTSKNVAVNANGYTFMLDGGNLTAGALAFGTDATGLTIDSGADTTGKLVVNSAISASGKTITVNNGAVLQATATGSSFTLAGNGTYALADGVSTKDNGVTFDAGWVGTVRISNAGSSSSKLANMQTVFSNLSNGGKGTVEVNNVQGWLGGDVATNLLLTGTNADGTGAAITILDGSTKTERVYSGKISGKGDYVYAWAAGNGWQTHNFSNDVSGWTGTFRTTVSGTTDSDLKFTGSTTVNASVEHNRKSLMALTFSNSSNVTMNGAISKGDGATLNLVVDAPTTTFTNSVGVTSLTVNASKGAKLNGATVVENGITLNAGSSLTVGATGSLQMGGTVTFAHAPVIVEDGGTVSFANTVVFNLDTLDAAEQDGQFVYTLFNGGNVNMSGLTISNIHTAQLAGKAWDFTTPGKISYTVSAERVWNGPANGVWDIGTTSNWLNDTAASTFSTGNTAVFTRAGDSAVVTGAVAAAAIELKNSGTTAELSAAAEGTNTLSAPTLSLDAGTTLTTNLTVGGLSVYTVGDGATWNINAEQALGTGTNAGTITVGEDGTAILNSSENVNALLLGISGAGSITLGVDATITGASTLVETQARGTLTIGAGKKLTISGGKANHADIDSFSAVVMESGASIDSTTASYTIHNLTSNGNTIKFSDTADINTTALHLEGTTTLNGNLKIESGWKYKMEIDKLTGTGSLELTGGAEAHQVYIHNDSSIASITMGDGMDGSGANKSSLLALEAGMTLSGDLTLKRGTTEISGTTTVGGAVDLSVGSSSTATLRVKEGGELVVNGTLWGRSASHLYVENGGQVTFTGDGLEMAGTSAANAGISTSGGNTKYTAGEGTYTLSGLAVTATKNVTIGNALANSSVATGTNTVTLNNAGNTLASVSIGNGGTLKAGADGALGGLTEITLGSGQTLDFQGTRQAGLTTLTINAGGTAKTSRNSGEGVIGGTININAGGTLQVYGGGQDAFGYSGGQNDYTDSIVMTGAEGDGNGALLDLAYTGSGSVTMTTNLDMRGYATVQGKSINSFGGNISASNTHNTIDTLSIRNNVTVTVADSGDLTIGTVVGHGTDGNEGNQILTKEGAGSLNITGAAAMKGLTHNAGSTAFNGALAVAGDVTVGGGNVGLQAAGSTIGGALSVNAGTLSVGESGGATVTGLTTVAGSLVNAGELTLNSLTLGEGSSFSNSGTLNLNGTVIYGAGTSIANSGSVTVADNLLFNVDALTATQRDGVYTYTLFSGDDVDLSRFSDNAVAHITGSIITTGRTWSFGTDGTLSYTIDSRNLMWSSYVPDTWTSEDDNVTPWSVYQVPGTTYFHNGDSVTFSYVTGDERATLDSDVTVATMTLDGSAGNVTVINNGTHSFSVDALDIQGGHLTTNTAITVKNASIASGAEWSLGGALDLDSVTTFSNNGLLRVLNGVVLRVHKGTTSETVGAVTADAGGKLYVDNGGGQGDAKYTYHGVETAPFKGTLVYDVVSGNSHDNTIALENFQGTLELRGRLAASTSDFGGMTKLVLNGDRDTNYTGMWNKEAFTLNVPVDIVGNHTVDLYTSKALTITGAVNGDGVKRGHLGKQNTGALTFNGAVTLLDFTTAGGNVTFNAGATMDAMTINDGTVTLNGGGSLGDMHLAGGSASVTLGGADKDYSFTSVKISSGNLSVAESGVNSLTADDLVVRTTSTLSSTAADPTVFNVTNFDVSNYNTNFTLQNVTLNVSGAATAAVLNTAQNVDQATVTVGDKATLNLDGSVVWKKVDEKDATKTDYVNLTIANGGAAHVNGGEHNILNNVTLNHGGSLSFATGTTTEIAGTLALADTITNAGTVTINSGSVAANQAGTLSGNGTYNLNGTITNSGTLHLADATFNGGEGATITGNVVIHGGLFSGSLAIGSAGTTIAVTKAFTVADGISLNLSASDALVLDNLEGVNATYTDGVDDPVYNGFLASMTGTVFHYLGEEEPHQQVSLPFNVTYHGNAGALNYNTDTKTAEFEIGGSKATFYVNTGGTEETYSHAKDVGGDTFTMVQLADGTSFDIDSANAALSRVTVKEGAEASLTIGGSNTTITAVETGAELTLTGEGSLTLGSAAADHSLNGAGTLVIDGPTVTINGTNNTSFTGNVDIKSGTLKLGDSTGDKFVLGAYNYTAGDTRTITVRSGATLDINGKADANYVLTLDGGRFTNNAGGGIASSSSQVVGLKLTANSYVGETGHSQQFWLRERSYKPAPTLELNEFNLTKQGTSTFGLHSTTVTGTGYLVVEEGTVQFNDGGTFGANFRLMGGTVASGQAGAVTGTVNLTENTTIDATAESTSTFAAVITGTGKSVTKTGAGTVTLTGANTYTGGTTITAGTVKTANATALGTGNVTVASGTLLVSEDLTIQGDSTGTHKGLDNQGTVSIADGKMLTLYGTSGGKYYDLGAVDVAGTTATIKNTNFNATVWLSSVSGAVDSSLALLSDHSANPATWNLGTADSGSFSAGELVLQAGDSGTTATTRAVNFNFNNAGMFSGATVKLQNAAIGGATKTMNNNVVLNAATVKVGGISDAVEGTVVEGRNWNISKGNAAGARATLELDGNDANGYSTAVKVGANIDIKKTGSATQVFSGDTSQFNGSIDVEGGTLNIMNIAQATSLSVRDVTIKNATLGVYSGETATADTDHEGTLTIKSGQKLTAAGTATLNAGLVMETGSTLDVTGTNGAGLAMGSPMTLNTGMNLEDYSSEWSDWEDGTKYALFSGVDSLNIGLDGADPTAAIDYTQWVDAKDYFKNLGEANRYFLCYDGAPADNQNGVLQASFNGSNVGTVYIMVMPEPTTSTLSLLALCALAARRRRK